jgi:hypothetical protein
MLRVASRIRADIERQQILHRLFKVDTHSEPEPLQLSEEDRGSFLLAMRKSRKHDVPQDFMFHPECYVNDQELGEMDCSEYRLICCGHSLGSVRVLCVHVSVSIRFSSSSHVLFL